ncbi:MAG: diaminopropionate ammonia-lyase [Spirochaetales bacterium]|nr:diaminopropionate ammonia-lyase [Spirochaetales bacterium]
MCRYAFKNRQYSFLNWPRQTVAMFESGEALEFHKSIPGYAETPLVRPAGLAKQTGVGCVYVKNEAMRFDVKAFKPLGASYAIFHYLSLLSLKQNGKALAANVFADRAQLAGLPQSCFCAATDGNHGRAVAWTAKKLGQKAVIFMPSTASETRQQNIKKEGARLVLIDGTFDDCVRECQRQAGQNGWQVISDTAYEGNMELPAYIIQGYRTIFIEIDRQLHAGDGNLRDDDPGIDLLLLPAGVGGLAAAGAGFYALKYGEYRPIMLCIEPDDADCFLRSARAGEAVQSPGKQESIMVGLACGFPSLAAWPICRDVIDAYIAIPDKWAVLAMKSYAGNGIVSGESGSAGLAGLLALMQSPTLGEVRSRLGVDGKSRVMCINTEGDTDPFRYHEIIGSNG